jgi:hypothetical protein
MAEFDCGCCDDCRAQMPDDWVFDFWRYCEHLETLSLRFDRTSPWAIYRGVGRDVARGVLEAGLAVSRQPAAAHGVSLAQADAIVVKLRE